MAEGRTTRPPDLVTINTGVVTQALTAAEALTDNAGRVKRVVAALKTAGVADRDIRSANISLQPQYRYADNTPPVITGYQASNSIAVRFRDIARAGTILDALVREGANQIDGPNFVLDKPEAALDEARADAVAKARARAGLYARIAGLRVDRILSISENPGANVPIVITAMRANMAGAASEADTKVIPGEQDVTISLSVRFLLK
ncbi:SIMPL domain-containing protein [Sphingomonas koreensis]